MKGLANFGQLGMGKDPRPDSQGPIVSATY